MQNRPNIWDYIGLVLFAFMVAFTVHEWHKAEPKPTSSPAITIPIKSAEVKHEEKVEVVLPQSNTHKAIRAYSSSVKAHIVLPKEVLADEQKVVTDSSQVRASERPTVVTSVLDTSTGETTTYTHDAPLPWFQTEQRGNLSLEYGFKRNASQPVARLNYHEDLLEIKAVHLGTDVSVYSDGDYFIGAGISYRW